MRRRSSAGLLALLVFARGAAAQTAPAMPAMPQVPSPAGASAGDDVVATPFGPMTRNSLNAASSPAVSPGGAPRPKAASSGGGGVAKSTDKVSSGKSPSPKPPATTAPAEEPPAKVDPPAVIVAPAAAAPAPAPAASAEAPRSWLRDKPKAQEPAPKEEPRSSPWRALFALLVVAGLGGFAFVARQRRGKTQALPPGASRIVVLSTAKIGPKANAVVAEVAGRVYLLGVTDSSVSRLAVLENGEPRAVRAPRPKAARPELANDVDAEDARAALLRARRAPVETADADEAPRERPLSSKFGEMLDRALGVRSPAGVPDFRGDPAVAALLAADVDDVINVTDTAPRGREAYPASRPVARTITAEVVEEQVAGLSRKRRRS